MFNIKNYQFTQNIDDREFKKSTFAKRKEIIELAIRWPGYTTKNSFIFNNIWTYKKGDELWYIVSLGKFGKEYYQSGTTGHGVKNCNDMKPSIIHGGKVLQTVKGGFDDIFRLMEKCKKDGQEDVLQAFLILFLRNALLFDHRIIDGKYSYQPDENLVKYICDRQQEYEGVPMEVYIHFLDAIGLNEDVKYHTQGKLNASNGIGRENNMRTYIYNICCILGLMDWSGFIYKLIRGFGVAAITNTEIAKLFPELGIVYKEAKPRARRNNVDEIVIKDIIDQEPPKD